MSDIWNDEIGRCFCDKHRREQCHVCCYDFDMINRNVEIDKGIRKAPSEIEKLAEEQSMLLNGIKFMKNNRMTKNNSNYDYHQTELKRVEQRLAELRAAGETNTIADAVRSAQLKLHASDTEMAAITDAWAKDNPGKTSMEFGGEETQKYFDQVAAPPPSADTKRADKHTCAYCGKSSAEKMSLCARCKAVAYCGKECQRAAWSGHKKVCIPIDSPSSDAAANGEKAAPVKGPKLPLTWEQLEAYGSKPAEGKVLEVRIMISEPYFRAVMECKDRVGAVRRIAAYTNSKQVPGAAVGKVLRWRNPKFHWFMDGSSGARIEEADLANITISDD